MAPRLKLLLRAGMGTLALCSPAAAALPTQVSLPASALLAGAGAAAGRLGICAVATNPTRTSAASAGIVSGLGMARGFASRALAWETMLALPSRKEGERRSDLATVSQMLPNRKALSPQFSPHGISLVPSAILAPLAAAAAPTTPVASANAQQESESETMEMADKTRQWRRLKMKKHKIRKRRKALRYVNAK